MAGLKVAAVWAAADQRAREAAPFLSYGSFTGHAPRDICANWPVAASATPHSAVSPGQGKVVVVSTTHDPATRYDFAKRMTRELGNARLLTLDGYGHTTSYSACITGWYSRYLIDGALPPVGTHCKQDLAPFPTAS